ncbi:MAG: hypothetical protein IEMM0008_0438 [bacterium]|nr:MAG: hypothetical protein IEMM0008_0438 [bacterium]
MKKFKLKVHNHSIQLPVDLQLKEGEEVTVIIKDKVERLEQAKLYKDFDQDDRRLAEEDMESYNQILRAEDETTRFY